MFLDAAFLAIKKYPCQTTELLHFKETLMQACASRGVKVHSDTLGEFSISALMNMFGLPGDRAAEIAAGWGGDLVLLSKDRQEERLYLNWQIH